jgi:hypothetical protein
VKQARIYKEHRVHADQMPNSGLWISTIVKLGQTRAITKDSLTAKVTRIPGEYRSEEEAIAAAKRYIDKEEAHGQD